MDMRRLVIESSISEVGRCLGVEAEIGKLDYFEVVSLLREESDEWAMICKPRMKDPRESFEKALRDDSAHIQLLEEEKDGAQIYFVRHKPNSVVTGLFATGGFISIPLEIREGRIRASFLGSSPELMRLLKVIDKAGLRYKITSNTHAKFSLTSPLACLTEKQRKVITAAFNFDYYEIPKKINSEELAKKLHIREAMFVRHRIKAERRLLAALFYQ